MATFNSATKRWLAMAAVIFLTVCFVKMAFADDQQEIFAARTKLEFQSAQKQFQADDDSTNAWRFARACYDLADFAASNAARAALANQGIGVCRELLAREPQNAAGHYYLGMNLGQLARTKSLGALKLVREMENEFEAALKLDAAVDFGGPARSLGLLYRDAPDWPMSIGSKRKAKIYLARALKIAPDFPENYLILIESDLKWSDRAAAKKELDALDALWPEAQKKFAGAKHERDWDDWTARRAAARQKLFENSKPLKSPRNK